MKKGRTQSSIVAPFVSKKVSRYKFFSTWSIFPSIIAVFLSPEFFLFFHEFRMKKIAKSTYVFSPPTLSYNFSKMHILARSFNSESIGASILFSSVDWRHIAYILALCKNRICILHLSDHIICLDKYSILIQHAFLQPGTLSLGSN